MKKKLITEPKSEMVAINTLDGKTLPCCSKFKYLGTTLSSRGRMGPEIVKRSAVARAACNSLRKLWRSRVVSKKVKKQFFQTMVLTILLYNAETWALNQHEEKKLMRAYNDMARRAMNKHRTVAEEGVGDQAEFQKREADNVFLANHNLERVERIITFKKIIWLARVRRGEDRGETLLVEKFNQSKNAKDAWYRKLSEELESVGLTVDEAIKMATKPEELRKRINQGKPDLALVQSDDGL